MNDLCRGAGAHRGALRNRSRGAAPGHPYTGCAPVAGLGTRLPRSRRAAASHRRMPYRGLVLDVATDHRAYCITPSWSQAQRRQTSTGSKPRPAGCTRRRLGGRAERHLSKPTRLAKGVVLRRAIGEVRAVDSISLELGRACLRWVSSANPVRTVDHPAARLQSGSSSLTSPAGDSGTPIAAAT